MVLDARVLMLGGMPMNLHLVGAVLGMLMQAFGPAGSSMNQHAFGMGVIFVMSACWHGLFSCDNGFAVNGWGSGMVKLVLLVFVVSRRLAGSQCFMGNRLGYFGSRCLGFALFLQGFIYVMDLAILWHF